jgi:alanine-synthesizing transaminase
VQVAAPALLDGAIAIRARISARVQRNLRALRLACASCPSASTLSVEGGWSAVLQVPAIRSEEDLVMTLVTEDGVLVHPGYFFDMTREAFLVVSLIVEPALFDRGIAIVVDRAAGSRS